MAPLVSVCVLSMNHERYIEQCLRSIVEQDYENLEIVYVDNNSNDKTYEIAISFLEKSKFPFQTIKRNKNYPTAPNCNLLLSLASGKYACMTSADDWLDQGNISKKMNRLLGDPDAAAAYSHLYFYYNDSNTLEEKRSEKVYEGYVYDQVVKGNFVSSPGIVWDLEKVKEVGMYNENIKLEDWDLIIRLAKRYKILFVDEFLVYYRRHSNNASAENNREYFLNQLQVIEQYKEHHNYKYCKQQIVYRLYGDICDAKPSLRNLWETIKVQDGSIYLINVLKHNFLKIFRPNSATNFNK